MSVTLRYWLRWSLEAQPRYPLLPAYLSSGDHYSIQFMEFPFINILLAPLFALGVEWGRVFNNFGLLILNLALTYWAWCKWKGTEIRGVLVDDAFLLFPLISASGFFFYKQIPDYTAAILVTLALGYSYDEKKRNFGMSFILLALGTLIKPPQVIALAPLLLHHNRKYILKSMTWILPAAIPCVLYYTIGSKAILELGDTKRFFGTDFRDPLFSLISVIKSPVAFFNLFIESFFGRYVGIPLILFYLYNAVKNKTLKTSPFGFILFLQTLALALMDGKHLFIHDYYLCGFALTVSLIFINFLKDAPKFLVYTALLILTLSLAEKSFYETRGAFKNNLYKQCSALKERNPDFPWDKDYVFSSTKAVPPQLGLCFGVRQDSKTSDYGFFYTKQEIPSRCKEVDREDDIILTKCNS